MDEIEDSKKDLMKSPCYITNYDEKCLIWGHK